MVRISLRTKFAVVTSLLLSVTIGGMTAVAINRERQSLARQLETKAIQFAQLATVEIFRVFLSIHDSESAKTAKIQEVVSADPDIENLTIIFASQRVLFDLRNPGKVGDAVKDPYVLDVFDRKRLVARKVESSRDGERFEIVSPFIERGFVFGVLRLEIPLEPFRALVRKRVREIVGLSLISILLGILVSVIFARTITRTIEQFIRSTERIAAGDLTRRLELEQPREFGRLASAFNNMAMALQSHKEDLRRATTQLVQRERLAALGELSARIAHEIKNPIGIIRSSAQIVQDPKETPDVKAEVAQYIVEEADRLNTTLSEFLDYARPAPPVPQGVELDRFFERTLQFWESHQSDRKLTIVRTYAEALPKAWVDPETLRQIALNLFLNASEAMPRGGTLRIATGRDPDGGVRIEFTDSGPGIPAEHLSRIFDPFFTTKPEGTGLGLSIVHQLLERQGGRISVESAAGKGTRAIITLPVEGGANEAVPDSHR